MTERRQHPRFRIRQLIKLDFGREDYLEARAVDIGEGGLRLCSGQPLEVGSRVFVMLSSKNAKGEEDYLTAEGVVVRTELKQGATKCYESGVEFVDLDEEKSAALKAIIDDENAGL
jgi:hypothetical protein